jgi:methylmalonyl-CoA mutase N-terminal domain/subunit
VIVGVNRIILKDEKIDIPVLRIDKVMEDGQVAFCKKIKAERDNAAVEKTLANLREVAKSDGNTFDAILDAARVYASVGEICDVLREEWGEWVESPAAMQVS